MGLVSCVFKGRRVFCASVLDLEVKVMGLEQVIGL